jgi:hypothetical protein
MYYNRILCVWVVDALDYFLISAIIGSFVASHLKNYLSEKAAMERLKKSIINKSKLASKTNTPLLNSKEAKIKKIWRFANNLRGGCNYEYQLADQIKNLVTVLAVYLKKKELGAKVLKIIFTQGIRILQLVLYMCKINLQYVVVDPVSPQVIVIVVCTGGTFSFIWSWFLAGTTLVVPPTLLSFFLLRSSVQQIQHNVEYTKLKNSIGRFLKDKNLQEEMKNLLIKTQNQIDNSKKIKLEHLNWNKNPAIKEAAERLGIFESAPSATEPLNLETLDPDPDLKKILEEFGLIKTPNSKTPIKTRIKGKTVNFRDFVERMVDGDNKSDLDVIDAEIVQKSVQIKIKD